ncbi:hypothetical protein BY996DRAFT_6416528 [Phakopsora pachyrhizi]|nr:hypothetical protein BY996DRAFT_6416528 [Phakopsora pachyrhizi]
MKRINHFNNICNTRNLQFLSFIPILNFVLSINPPCDFDVPLAPQLVQAPQDLRSSLGSLSENSRFVQPSAGSSAAITPNFENIFPHQPIVLPSWQNLPQHMNTHSELLFSHHNEALSLEKPDGFDVFLAPQFGHVSQDFRSAINSRSENSQFIQPSRSNSAVIKTNFEHVFPPLPVDFSSWRNLPQHMSTHKEILISHENKALNLENAVDFNVIIAPQIGQAPQDLLSSHSALLENSRLVHPLESSSVANTPGLEQIFLPPVDLQSWQELAQHQIHHHENLDNNHQSPSIYSYDYNFSPQFEKLNGATVSNFFFDEINSNENTFKTSPGVHLSSSHNSNNHNQDCPFDTLVDFDPIDEQFNSMISADFITKSHHEQNINEESIFSCLLDEVNRKINSVESLDENKMPSDLTEKLDHPHSSLLLSSINKEDPVPTDMNRKVLKSSKSQIIAKTLNHKRKYDYISESKSGTAEEPISEVLKVLGPEGGTINMKLKTKNQLDGLVKTSYAIFKEIHEILEKRLIEPERTYKLLNRNNMKTFEENKSSICNQKLYSFQPREAVESPIKAFENSVSKPKYTLDFGSEDPKTRLKALRILLFEQLNLQEYKDLRSLNNYVEYIYRSAESKFHPNYVLGCLIDWNVKKDIGEKVLFF